MYTTLQACCESHYLWQLSTCLGASAAAGTGSNEWYMDYDLNKCVKDCVGASPCGGLADGEITFSTQDKCCEERMWWDERECKA
jgi:hypothetical protein